MEKDNLYLAHKEQQQTKKIEVGLANAFENVMENTGMAEVFLKIAEQNQFIKQSINEQSAALVEQGEAIMEIRQQNTEIRQQNAMLMEIIKVLHSENQEKDIQIQDINKKLDNLQEDNASAKGLIQDFLKQEAGSVKKEDLEKALTEITKKTESIEDKTDLIQSQLEQKNAKKKGFWGGLFSGGN